MTTTAAGLEEKLKKGRAMWEQECEELVEQAKDQVADAADGLRVLVQHFDIPCDKLSANCFLVL